MARSLALVRFSATSVVAFLLVAAMPASRGYATSATDPEIISAIRLLAETEGIFTEGAGGVTVSYFEWVQDLQFYFWNEREINARLKEIMTAAFNHVWDYAEEEGVDLRTAALMLAVKRLAEAKRLRGLYP